MIDLTDVRGVKFTSSLVYLKVKGNLVMNTNDIKYEESFKDFSKITWILTKGTPLSIKAFILGLLLGQVNAWVFKAFMEEHYSNYLTRRRLKLIYSRISNIVGMGRIQKLLFIYL